MLLEDVKLQESNRSDKRSPYYYRSRVVRLDTDLGNVYTPSRVVSRYEYNARSSLPLSRILPIQTAIDFMELDERQVINMKTDAKIGNKIIGITKQFNDIASNAIFRISIFQPPKSVLSVMSIASKIDFADLQAKFFQINLNAGLVTYPHLDLPLTDYMSFIDSRYRRNQDLSTIFTLDMGMEPTNFENLLGHLASKEQPMIILLIYRNVERTLPQHNVINSYFDNEKLLFFACQVEREESQSHSSNLHAVSYGGGFDLVASKQTRGWPNKENVGLSKLKMFDPVHCSLRNLEDVLSDPTRDVLKEFDIPKDNFHDIEYIKSIIKGFRGAVVHPEKYDRLYYFTKVHEAIVSSKLFDTTRSKIGLNEMEQYIKNTNLRLAPMIKNRT